MRDKFRTRSADYEEGPDAENYLAKTIYLPMRMGPIGFVHFGAIKYEPKPTKPVKKPTPPKKKPK